MTMIPRAITFPLMVITARIGVIQTIIPAKGDIALDNNKFGIIFTSEIQPYSNWKKICTV